MGDDINYRKILKEKKIYNIGNFEQKIIAMSDCKYIV